MIYRLTVVSKEVEDFVAEIQIDPYDSFFTLHEALLDLCGFDDNEPTSFTVCTANWKKLQKITLVETDTAADEDSYVMDETALIDFLEDEKQHLIYRFDPEGGRSLYLELTEIITGKSMQGAMVTRRHGTPPPQTIEEDDTLELNILSGGSSMMDDEMYGGVVSDEDINAEGLDISEGEPFDS